MRSVPLMIGTSVLVIATAALGTLANRPASAEPSAGQATLTYRTSPTMNQRVNITMVDLVAVNGAWQLNIHGTGPYQPPTTIMSPGAVLNYGPPGGVCILQGPLTELTALYQLITTNLNRRLQVDCEHGPPINGNGGATTMQIATAWIDLSASP